MLNLGEEICKEGESLFDIYFVLVVKVTNLHELLKSFAVETTATPILTLYHTILNNCQWWLFIRPLGNCGVLAKDNLP